MKASFTPKQIRKIHSLSMDNLVKLLDIIAAGGTVKVPKLVVHHLSGLREVGLVRQKGDTAWVRFEVDGVKPRPFLGHKQKKSATDPQKFTGMFMRIYKSHYNESYGVFTAKEWKFATNLCKEFDIEELEMMLESFFRINTATNDYVQRFYGMRHRIHRSIALRIQERRMECEEKPQGTKVSELRSRIRH